MATKRRPGDLPEQGIVRRNYGSGHGYRINGERVPGVTSISSYIKGAGLINYTGRMVAEAAVNDWDALAELPPVTRYNALYDARWAERDAAANRGTEVHIIAGKLNAAAEGEEVDFPEELEGYVRSYQQWLDDFQPKIMASELVVANRTVRYCGTLDLIADLGELIEFGGWPIPPARWVVDVKTKRSGPFPEDALQLCGYFNAEVYVHPGDRDEVPMAALALERAAVLWVRKDGYDFKPMEVGPIVWDYFRKLAAIYHQDESRKEWVGATARPA